MGIKLKEFFLLFLLLLLCLCCATDERSKRQLFREQIPHNRPLSGNSYHMHHGFPHPGRFNENTEQIIPPNPNFSSTPPPEIPDGEAHDTTHATDLTTHPSVVNNNSHNNNNKNLIVAVHNNENSALHTPHKLHLNKYQHLNTISGYWHLLHQDFQLLTAPYAISWNYREKK